MRVVVDTGILVSALISSKGTIGGVLHALRDGRFTAIYSTPMMLEVADVLGRSKIQQKYHIQSGDIEALINLVRLRGELVIPKQTITACRDPKDNKFLEAALAGEADAIVTGDDDLLVLHPFEGVDILRPVELLEKL
ncbi:MAG: putative toxin-antitoxin system toxin component, PIN family [Anaerolineales bacterium]|nr:MAG: putative toxin-antitoxin system toxin component, PIN family [Anaerolineales bacterium]